MLLLFAENFFKQWIGIYGSPTVTHTDQGQQFLSQTISDLCHRHSISSTNSCVYHPKVNAIVEHVHRTLRDRFCCISEFWSDNINEAV